MLACAALLPNLVAAAASLCSSAPYDAEGLDWFAGFSRATLTRLITIMSGVLGSSGKTGLEW